MQLFDLTKILFSSPDKWKTLSRGDKKKNHFMVNRLMSIQFPLQAQAFNNLKIDPVATLDAWQKFLENKYHQVPYWMYTKGTKKKKEEKEKKLNIKDSTILLYAKRNGLELKAVRDAIKFFPKESAKELKRFEKIIQ
jgi:hypothetical protein